MANVDALIKAWDLAIWEYSLVFEELADEDVWRRAHPRLLSIGELTGHVAYWEPNEPSPDGVSAVSIQSVLNNPAFRYYETQVENPFSLDVSAADLIAELKRIHEEAKTAVTKRGLNGDDLLVEGGNVTYGQYLQYRGFHAAYHAGQAYSVRHIFGHKTTGN